MVTNKFVISLLQDTGRTGTEWTPHQRTEYIGSEISCGVVLKAIQQKEKKVLQVI